MLWQQSSILYTKLKLGNNYFNWSLNFSLLQKDLIWSDWNNTHPQINRSVYPIAILIRRHHDSTSTNKRLNSPLTSTKFSTWRPPIAYTGAVARAKTPPTSMVARCTWCKNFFRPTSATWTKKTYHGLNSSDVYDRTCFKKVKFFRLNRHIYTIPRDRGLYRMWYLFVFRTVRAWKKK